MKEIVNIYKRHKPTVENYVLTMLKNVPNNPIENADLLLSEMGALQLLYAVDMNYKQSSPVICRKKREHERINSDKTHYFTKLTLSESDIYVGMPYIHHRDGRPSITAVKLIGDTYYIFDFSLLTLLEELRLIEHNTLFDYLNRSVYSFGGSVLALVSVFLIGYGGYTFIDTIFANGHTDILHDIFKAIIAITLGLAIYDLARQILEQEVVFLKFERDEGFQNNVLSRFLISIIIALSIETLMVVFKIALGDYTQMIAAFYLLVGVTLMIVGLALFNKFTKSG